MSKQDLNTKSASTDEGTSYNITQFRQNQFLLSIIMSTHYKKRRLFVFVFVFIFIFFFYINIAIYTKNSLTANLSSLDIPINRLKEYFQQDITPS